MINLPVQGNGDSTQPRTQNGANHAAIYFVHWQQKSHRLPPCITADSMDVDERQGAQHGDMRGSQEGMSVVCRGRGTKEHEDGGQKGCGCQGCEEKGEERRLYSMSITKTITG